MTPAVAQTRSPPSPDIPFTMLSPPKLFTASCSQPIAAPASDAAPSIPTSFKVLSASNQQSRHPPQGVPPPFVGPAAIRRPSPSKPWAPYFLLSPRSLLRCTRSHSLPLHMNPQQVAHHGSSNPAQATMFITPSRQYECQRIPLAPHSSRRPYLRSGRRLPAPIKGFP